MDDSSDSARDAADREILEELRVEENQNSSEPSDESADDEEDEDYESAAEAVTKLPGGKKKRKRKRGPKSPWEEDMIDDLVDIITNDARLTRKLIFENTKKIANKVLYEDILEKLSKRLTDRSVKCEFTFKQVRTRFKRCISVSKEAALTVKTATGIKRFRDLKGYGKWFMQLYPLVKSRDSCQAEQGKERKMDKKKKTTNQALQIPNLQIQKENSQIQKENRHTCQRKR